MCSEDRNCGNNAGEPTEDGRCGNTSASVEGESVTSPESTEGCGGGNAVSEGRHAEDASGADGAARLAEELSEVLKAQREISEKLSELAGLFDKRIMYVAHEEKIVDAMHKELQTYKDGLKFQLVKPVLQDIIAVADSINRITAAYLSKPAEEQNIPAGKVAGFIDDLHEVLERNDIGNYRSETGDLFKPVRQKAIKEVPTEDETLHGKIAASVSYGYESGGRVISAEKVYVYTKKKNG